MSEHLLAISIGPVQGFIVAARRTRDFWMGSAILSEVAKAVALAAVRREEGAAPDLDRLVFPAPLKPEDLQPMAFDAENRELKNEFDVTNVILCVLEAAPEEIAEEARRLRSVTQARWREIARKAANRCGGELRPDWETQLRDELIEFYAAWVPLSDDAGYADARRRVTRLLGGRKACRDFEPWQGIAGVPKSSLDASRETVLEDLPRSKSRRRRLRVKSGEQLDLAGVMKRAEWGHDSIRYPSLSRVAIDPWIRGIVAAGIRGQGIRERFDEIQEVCQELARLGVLRERKSTNRKGIENDLDKFPWLKDFPFEGTPLYVNRHQELRDELAKEAVLPEHDDEQADADVVEDQLTRLQVLLRELGRAHPFTKPWEYAAFLAADGDRMGATLSEIAKLPDGLRKHREFSRRQSEFAVEVRRIMGRDFSGACFYAGADDVLAMVAVDQAIACARRLHDRFGELLGELVQSWGLAPPTLSVGIAVGHFLEPLEDLLRYARKAEDRAKNPTEDERAKGQAERNGLAVSLHPRGGASFTVRDNWMATADQPRIDERIESWAKLHRQRQLSAKAAYDLRLLAAQYGREWRDPAALCQAIRRDAVRLLRRKRGLSGVPLEDVRPLVERLLQTVATPRDLFVAAHELMLGQWIGDALDQAAGVSRRSQSSLTAIREGENV